MLLDQISVTLINYTMKIVMDTIGIGRCCCSKFDIEIELDRRPKEVNRFFIDSMLLFFLQFSGLVHPLTSSFVWAYHHHLFSAFEFELLNEKQSWLLNAVREAATRSTYPVRS